MPAKPNIEDAIASYKKRKAVGKAVRKLNESDIEDHLCNMVKTIGGTPYKFTSPGKRAVPDRLCLLPIPAEHREIVRKYVRFVEAKRPGETATPAQRREHDRLRELGFYVVVIDTKEGGDLEFNNLFERQSNGK